MSKVLDGNPGDLPPVDAMTPAERFDNAIREFGVVNACEWFGHHSTSEFTKETVDILRSRKGLG